MFKSNIFLSLNKVKQLTGPQNQFNFRKPRYNCSSKWKIPLLCDQKLTNKVLIRVLLKWIQQYLFVSVSKSFFTTY